MSFSTSYLGHAEKVHDEFSISTDGMVDRQARIVQAVEDAVKSIVEAVGGHVSASAYGHANESPQVGDSVNINIAFTPDPAEPTVVPPVQDPDPSLSVSDTPAAPVESPAPAEAVPVADPSAAASSDPTVPSSSGTDTPAPSDQQVEVSEQGPAAPVADPPQDPSSASSPSTDSAPAPGQSSGDASATSWDESSAGTTPTADPTAPAQS